MGNLWNRSSSLASSGGITSRTGSGTEEVYRQQSIPTSSGESWLGRVRKGIGKAWNWLSNHSEGVGKLANAAGMIGAASLGGPTGLAAYGAAKTALGAIGDELKDSKFHKFTQGLENQRVEEKAKRAYDLYKSDRLDKAGKLEEFNKLLKEYRGLNNKPIANNPVSNSSNGHVPAGYQATSSQGASVIATNKNKNKKGKKQWNEWLDQKTKNKNKKGRKKK